MKRLSLIFALLLITACAFAQAPNWQWAAQAGGSSDDYGLGIATDDNGNSYVTGYFRDTATFGSYSLTSSGEFDIFVAKMDANGNWLWATQAGGSNSDCGLAIAIDNNGTSYVTGSFQDTATFGSYSLTSNGGYDIFVAKMDANGNWLWVAQAGGSNTDYGIGIAIDDNGSNYVTGIFHGTPVFGSYSLTSSGHSDIFAAKMDANGNWLWATQAGGNSDDFGSKIAIDENGDSYVTGRFYYTATFGSYSLTSSGHIDIFVAKMDANGNWLWATNAGGSSWDQGGGIAIDENGNSYVTGWFSDTAYFGSYSLTSSGYLDIFVAKMDATGNWLWATKAGGSSFDQGGGIAIDDNGNSYVTGGFQGTATFGSYSLTSSGNEDIFVAKMDANGNWSWAAKAGGSDYDYGIAIAIDDNGNSYVTGDFQGTATFGSYSLTSSGDDDIFVAKLNSFVFAENEINPAVNSLSNHPNPFNPSTTISFELNTEITEDTEISIYNLKGEKIKTLYTFPSGSCRIGTRGVIWNGTDENNQPVSSGIYFYKLRSGKFEVSRKMLLIK